MKPPCLYGTAHRLVSSMRARVSVAALLGRGRLPVTVSREDVGVRTERILYQRVGLAMLWLVGTAGRPIVFAAGVAAITAYD